jgi:hypothetical protein
VILVSFRLQTDILAEIGRGQSAFSAFLIPYTLCSLERQSLSSTSGRNKRPPPTFFRIDDGWFDVKEQFGDLFPLPQEVHCEMENMSLLHFIFPPDAATLSLPLPCS